MASNAARPDTESDQPTYDGHHYEFVDTVPDEYICPICFNVVFNAHLLSCCGKYCCSCCISMYRQTQYQEGQAIPPCPHCKQERFMNVINKGVIRQVKKLKIHCTNHSEGCGWVGELGGLESHLDSDKGCGYVEVTCTNEGCGERMSRKDLQTHLQEKCDSLPCPNRCGVTGIKYRDVPDHRSSCPLEPLNCPFKDAGCAEKIARKDMEDHMTANQQKHIVQGYLSLQHSNEQQKQELNATRKELQATKKELHTTQSDLQATKEELNTTKQEFKATNEELNTTKQELQATKKEVQSTKQDLQTTKDELQATKQELNTTKQELHYTKLELRGALFGLNTYGDTLTLTVTNFSQLKGREWRSVPFTISEKARGHLRVHHTGDGSVYVSLVLTEALIRDDNVWLRCNVSIAAIGQNGSPTHKTVLELCRFRPGFRDTAIAEPKGQCSAYSRYFNDGPTLQSQLFQNTEEANATLVHDTLILELQLLLHNCHYP